MAVDQEGRIVQHLPPEVVRALAGVFHRPAREGDLWAVRYREPWTNHWCWGFTSADVNGDSGGGIYLVAERRDPLTKLAMWQTVLCLARGEWAAAVRIG
jgi:hypothetical protein